MSAGLLEELKNYMVYGSRPDQTAFSGEGQNMGFHGSGRISAVSYTSYP